MAKFCPICNKGSQISGTRVLLRGNYNPTKTSRKYPNLQWASLPSGRRIKICTDCLKKGRYLKEKIK
ncbi:50S ribosomal protein L28 [Candidatus Giovannonibacteria bacterium]|nr:50S ribosomal protein L28 [Candidatus Giovannonibacteria bacterium]